MKAVTMILFALVLNGCASQAELQTLSNSRDRVVEAQAKMEQDKAAVIECGAEGCPGLKVTINRPRAPIIVPEVMGTNKTIANMTPAVANSIKWAVGWFGAARMADDLFGNLGGGNTNTHNTTAINTEGDVQFSSTSTLSNTDTTSNIGDTQMSDNHSIADSYNPSDDNSAVSVPTVVTQPAPVVVNPVIVPAP